LAEQRTCHFTQFFTRDIKCDAEEYVPVIRLRSQQLTLVGILMDTNVVKYVAYSLDGVEYGVRAVGIHLGQIPAA
jgi:hypothetical protein